MIHRSRFVNVMLIVAGSALLGVGAASGATALSGAHSTQVQLIATYGGDTMYNYDFSSQQVTWDNVDWAVHLMFWGNADINNVKSALQSVYGNSGGPQEFYGTDGGGLGLYTGWWDNDSGKKQAGCDENTWYRHYRIYAPGNFDYMYNIGWGRYVAGTDHYDINDGSGA